MSRRNRSAPASASDTLKAAERAIGHSFSDASVLFEALVHKSYANERTEENVVDNERLEFLGDAVLDLVVSHRLMEAFPEAREGALSRLRASLVNERSLAEAARSLGLGDLVLLGRGEDLSGGRDKDSILSNTYEAVLGAVYADGGLEACFPFIDRSLGARIEDLDLEVADRDHKTRLQEIVQRRHGVVPRYGLIDSSGPDHDRTFRVRLTVADVYEGEGLGKSKKAAEQDAARAALEALDDPGEPV